jgi:hypothetical protein
VSPHSFRIFEFTPDEQQQRLGRSWHPGLGCPEFLGLVRLEVLHRDFQGATQRGELDVAREIAPELLDVFRELFDARFPIARMRPIHHYDGDDDRSMADNNTSAFNCRRKVGKAELSLHAFGRAVDVNPVQNPYETASGLVLPAEGKPYARRDGRVVSGPGVLTSESVAVSAFESRGFVWGGRWTDPVDWQHFEKPLG